MREQGGFYNMAKNKEKTDKVVEDKVEETAKAKAPAKKAAAKAPAKKAEVKVEEKVVEVVEDVVDDAPIEVAEEQPKVAPVRQKVTKIDANELVCVRSVTKGGLTYISSKTGTTVKWENYGVEEYMEFGELLTMRASKPRFLNDPFIIVDDEDVAARLGLTKLYENMIDIDNLEGFYEQSLTAMEEQLDKVPKGIKRLISDKSRELIQNGALYDIRKIKLLEDKLQLDLQILLD